MEIFQLRYVMMSLKALQVFPLASHWHLRLELVDVNAQFQILKLRNSNLNRDEHGFMAQSVMISSIFHRYPLFLFLIFFIIASDKSLFYRFFPFLNFDLIAFHINAKRQFYRPIIYFDGIWIPFNNCNLKIPWIKKKRDLLRSIVSPEPIINWVGNECWMWTISVAKAETNRPPTIDNCVQMYVYRFAWWILWIRSEKLNSIQIRELNSTTNNCSVSLDRRLCLVAFNFGAEYLTVVLCCRACLAQ